MRSTETRSPLPPSTTEGELLAATPAVTAVAAVAEAAVGIDELMKDDVRMIETDAACGDLGEPTGGVASPDPYDASGCTCERDGLASAGPPLERRELGVTVARCGRAAAAMRWPSRRPLTGVTWPERSTSRSTESDDVSAPPLPPPPATTLLLLLAQPEPFCEINSWPSSAETGGDGVWMGHIGRGKSDVRVTCSMA